MITIYTLWQSAWIVGGLWCLSRLFKMLVYEILEKDAGEKYLAGKLEKNWKDYLEEKWFAFRLKK
jgi:hypothetical protein